MPATRKLLSARAWPRRAVIDSTSASPAQREVRRQVPPGAAGPVQVQDGLDDPPQRPDPRPSPPPGPVRRQVRRDDLPLGVGQVAGIAPGPPSGPPRTLGTRGPCFPGRHTSGSWGLRPFISTETTHGQSGASPSRPGIRAAARGVAGAACARDCEHADRALVPCGWPAAGGGPVASAAQSCRCRSWPAWAGARTAW